MDQKEFLLCETCKSANHKYISLCLAGCGYNCSKGHNHGLLKVPTIRTGCDDYEKRADEIPVIIEKRPNPIRRLITYLKDKFS